MTQKEIAVNRELFMGVAREHIQREGLENLLVYLDTKTDFFTAPSSASFHLNEAGGLCRHSLNVWSVLAELKERVLVPAIDLELSPFTAAPSDESVAIAALFHDVCKTKLYHQTEKWRKDANGRWQSYPGWEVKDDFPFGHGEKSCIILSSFLRLKQDELLAIRWHMGMFEMTEQGSSTRFAFRAAMEKSPLVSLLHTADMLASNCLEKTTTY